MTNQRTGRNFLPIVGVGIAIAAGGYYLSNRFLFGSELTPLRAAEIIPKEAVAIGYVSTEAQDWSQLQQIGIPQSLFQKNVDSAKKELFSNTNITYEGDIKPWLGGAAFAVFPSSSAGLRSENSTLLIFGIKNKLQAYNFFKKLEKEPNRSFKQTDYKGITITESNSERKQTAYTALLDDRLVAGIDRATVEEAIDVYKGEASLVSNDETKQILTQNLKLDRSVAEIYFVNYGKLLQDLASMGGTTTLNTLPLNSVKSMAIGIGSKEKSLHVRAIAKFDSEKFSLDLSPSKGQIISQFPDNTIAFFNGQKIDRYWSNTVTQLEQIPDTGNYLNEARVQFKNNVGLDLDRDIFGWMNGEFALGILSTQSPIIPNLGMGLGGVLALETSNPDTAKTTLAKLENLMQHSGLTPNQKNIDGTTMTQWREPNSNVALSYGWLKDNRLVFTLGDSVMDSIALSKTNSFDRNTKFSAIVKQLPSENLGYFYLDLEPFVSAFNRLPDYQKGNVTPEALDLMNSLVGIGGATTMPDKSTSQVDMLVRFK
ncbi:MAG: DUF3352 domain-containing protein [Xenococcaceae cyanobacterium]